MQSQDSSTTGGDIDNASEHLDIEGADDVWKSVSNSQSATDAAPRTDFSKDLISKPAGLSVRSPHSSQHQPTINESPPHSLPKSQPASSPHTSKRSDSEIITKSAVPLIDQPHQSSPQKQLHEMSPPLKLQPSSQKKGSEYQSATDSARADDTLQLESAVPSTMEIFTEGNEDLASYANFAL